ncbi:hypothetical protein Efla_005308 [Eimeria flavescens]
MSAARQWLARQVGGALLGGDASRQKNLRFLAGVFAVSLSIWSCSKHVPPGHVALIQQRRDKSVRPYLFGSGELFFFNPFSCRVFLLRSDPLKRKLLTVQQAKDNKPVEVKLPLVLPLLLPLLLRLLLRLPLLFAAATAAAYGAAFAAAIAAASAAAAAHAAAVFGCVSLLFRVVDFVVFVVSVSFSFCPLSPSAFSFFLGHLPLPVFIQIRVAPKLAFAPEIFSHFGLNYAREFLDSEVETDVKDIIQRFDFTELVGEPPAGEKAKEEIEDAIRTAAAFFKLVISEIVTPPLLPLLNLLLALLLLLMFVLLLVVLLQLVALQQQLLLILLRLLTSLLLLFVLPLLLLFTLYIVDCRVCCFAEANHSRPVCRGRLSLAAAAAAAAACALVSPW